MSTRELCLLHAVPDGGSLGIAVDSDSDGHDAMLVRRGETVYAYWNQCPHTGAPLDWIPHNFLDAEANLIVCAVHGARFTVQDGKCVSGPCAGQSLAKLDVQVQQGVVVLAEK